MEHNEKKENPKGSHTLSTEASVVGPPNDEIVSVEDIVPIQEIGMDYKNVFTTNEHFSSRDTLFEWVCAKGKKYGMVIVISRSDSGAGKKKPRVYLACERSGQYREFKRVETLSRVNNEEENVEKTNVKNGKRKRDTGTKKCGCPFRLKGRQLSDGGEWALDVVYGAHNHSLAENLEGHSYISRLSSAESDYIDDMSHGNCKPKDILFGLKEKFVDNKSTIRTIYNARMKKRVVERDGRSQMQQLMWKLKEHEYFHLYRRCEKTDTLKDLFFAHPASVDLLRTFPSVLFMDCTYKTNRYKLPLLEIVGVTSTHMTFFVAAAYLEFEREDNYMWACTTLKSLMDPSFLPNVIVTDREIALMNAIERTFPTSRHFLCRWHINKNILSNCKKMFRTKEKWELFNHGWNTLVLADTESLFNDCLCRLSQDFKEYPAVVKYVMEQWVEPYKVRFVSHWTNNVMHFDNTTTNRVESQHALLKRQLGSSQGNFETCWRQIHTLIETSHIAIKHSFEKSKNVVQHKYKSIVFMSLRGMVSIHALNKIYDEMKTVGESGIDSLLCGCVLRKTCGLPCAHEISEFMRFKKPIPLDQVDAFWRKLDTIPRKGGDVGVRVEMGNEFQLLYHDISAKYEQGSDSERLLILKRLKEIKNPTTTSMMEPDTKIRTRGRPKSTKAKVDKSTKRDPSKFEYVESIIDSCSPCEEMAYEVGTSNESPMFTTRPKKKVVRKQQTRLTTTSGFIDQIPPHFQSFVVSTTNVKSDGHCGFRAIAVLLGFSEDSWGMVRRDLYQELTNNKELYEKVFLEIGRVDEVLNILDFYEASAPKKHWFILPEMGYLVASAFNVALVCLAKSMSLTYLPFRTKISSDPKLICIAFVNEDHYIPVFLQKGHPLPPLANIWILKRHECAAGWKNFFTPQLELYSEHFIGRSTESIDLDLN